MDEVNKYYGFYRGLVVDNSGEEVLPDETVSHTDGRIRVQVFPMMSTVKKYDEEQSQYVDIEVDDTILTSTVYKNTDVLPYAIPAPAIGFGAGVDYGVFTVPAIGSYVWVFFEQGDINQPIYFASAPDATRGVPTSSVTNYPNRSIIKTPNGIEIVIDDTSDLLAIPAVTPQIQILMSDKVIFRIDETKVEINPITII